jgi:hypothetical protein
MGHSVTEMYHPQGHAQGLNVLGMDHHATSVTSTHNTNIVQERLPRMQTGEISAHVGGGKG